MIEMGINCFFPGILDLDFIHLLLVPLCNLIKIAKHQKILELLSQFFSSLWLLFYVIILLMFVHLKTDTVFK